MKARGDSEFVSVLYTFTFRNGRISCNKDARNADENRRVSRRLAQEKPSFSYGRRWNYSYYECTVKSFDGLGVTALIKLVSFAEHTT